jgi:two-component system sensor histidine kinase YesM
MKKIQNRFLSRKVSLFLLLLFIYICFLLLALLLIAVSSGDYIVLLLFSFLCLAGLLYFGYRWVWLPYQETEKVLQLFASGYTLQGIYELRYPFSPKMEDTLKKLRVYLNTNELISATRKQAQYLALQNQINPHFFIQYAGGNPRRGNRGGAGQCRRNDGGACNIFSLYDFQRRESGDAGG